MNIQHLQIAVEKAGGQTALASALSKRGRAIKQAHVWKWLNSPSPDKSPPAEYCPDIEAITGVRCEDLRPDVNWSVLRGTRQQTQGVEQAA